MTGQLTILLCMVWTLVTSAASILTSKDTMSWQDAVQFCAKDKKILRKGRPGFNEVLSEKFWTRIYEKEHFVYLIGCFNPSQIKTSSATNMTEAECLTCLNYHPFMFARSVDNNWCSCVYDALPDPPGRCDHNEHIFVFGTNDGYQNTKHGVQLKCFKNKPILIQKESHKKRELFCNNTVIPGKFTWQNAIERCKKASGKLKDIKFDDFCKTNYTKAWFGFGTVTSEEEYMKHSDLLEPKRCKSCAGLCQFENCSEHRKPKCESETKSTSVNVLYTTSMRAFYTLTTSGGRTQYVSPQQTTTSGSQHSTVITSQQTTRLLSQRTTICSVSITNQTTYNVGNNVYVKGGMYCTTRATSSTERSPFLSNDYDLSKILNRVCTLTRNLIIMI